ncbi:MAG: hypothetical protein JSR21_21620 [Proteobacteria bacterium]|nr:hypothetical protein [Pseudomonadota bacterium]
MVGITLSPEQIRQAPPEVRRWLEQQIAATLGLQPHPSPVVEPQHRLIGCGPAEVRAVLAQIRGALPVVNVFFELGRENAVASARGLRALRLDEIGRAARLQSVDQVIACLEAIDAALRRATGTEDAAMTGLDSAGHCIVADQTARSILALWQEIAAAQPAAAASEPHGAGMPADGAPVLSSRHYAATLPGGIPAGG